MRLFLAVAVLLLAFVAYTEAQEDTFEEKFAKFGQQFSDISKQGLEKAKSLASDIQNSEHAETIRNWWNEQMAKLQQWRNQ